MPFGPYNSFEDCVAKNSDKANPEGFCAWLEHQITGKWPGQNSMPEEAWTIYREAYASHLTGSTKPVATAEKEAHEHAVSTLQNEGWVESRIGWIHSMAAPKFRTVANVRIFASGTWTDSSGFTRDWEDSDLDGLVDAFNAGVPPNVPVKAGHTPDTFNQKIAEKLGVPIELVTGDHGKGQISIGRMATQERRGHLLMASFERVPEQIADLIEAGLFSTVSVEIEDNIGGFASAVTAVALLGAEEPAVEDATLDRALVFGGKRANAHVISFSKDADPDYLEREFETLREKLTETIKGMRGAPIFRAMMSNLRGLFDQITKRKHQAPSGDIPPEVSALADAEYQGNVDNLIRWVGNVGFDQCVASLTGKEGITDPVKVCGWLKGRAHQSNSKEATMPKSLKEFKEQFQEPPAPEPQGAGAELMAGMMAIATALGLGEEATVDDILAAIEQLKQATPAPEGEMAAKFQKATDDLTKATDRIATLEHNERVTGYLERTRLFTAIPNKTGQQIAVELAEIEETRGKEKADSMLSTYTELDKMGKAATRVLGTSRTGSMSADFEGKVTEYMKANPNVKRHEAVKAVMRTNPDTYQESVDESREAEK